MCYLPEIIHTATLTESFFILTPHPLRISISKFKMLDIFHQNQFKIQLNCTLDHFTKTTIVKTWFLDWLAKCVHKLTESATENIEKEWN